MKGTRTDGKRELRRALVARRASGGRLVALWRSGAVARRVLGLSAWRRARTILAYSAIRGEVDPAPLVRNALAAGRVVALPRITGPASPLAFHRVGASTPLVPGPFGILEPRADPATAVDPATADLVLVPGVAYTPAGERLGFGGGYYDALLKSAPGVAVGLAFEFQVVPALPRDPWDSGVDAVVTERRVRFCRGRRGTHSFRSSTRVPPTKN